MKAKFSPAAVGMFVLGALALFLFGFLSFGGSHYFSKPARFLVYFEESVSGLDPGAAVKINGVRVGRVAAINVRYDVQTRSAAVQTVCEIDRSVLNDATGQPIDLRDSRVLQSLIDKGLRARLTLTGITGLLFVELLFEDAKVYPPKAAFMDANYPVMPSIPSPISELQQSIVEIVADIKKVDFAGLSKEIKILLATTNQKVADFDVRLVAERITQAAAAIENFVGSPEAKNALTNLNLAITELRGTLTKLDQQIGPTAGELNKTLADAQTALRSIDAAAQTARNFVQAQSGLGEEVAQSLRQVADAAAAITRLADYLERNPNSLLVGRKPPQ